MLSFCSKVGNWKQREDQDHALGSDISLTFPEGKQKQLEFISKVFYYPFYLHIQAAKYINVK